MILMYLLLVLILGGIAYVAWLMWSEDKQNSEDSQEPSDRLTKDSGGSLFQKMEALTKFLPKGGFLKKNRPSLLRKEESPKTGTASLRLDEQPPDPTPVPSKKRELSSAEELSRQCDILRKQYDELQDNHSRLDTLFQEKCSALNKTESFLDNELTNRKEFNKVKDLLEKELKESRDKSRNLKIELANSQTEAQSHLKRIEQLEIVVAKLNRLSSALAAGAQVLDQAADLSRKEGFVAAGPNPESKSALLDGLKVFAASVHKVVKPKKKSKSKVERNR